jgi:hypothetical protein
MEKNSSIKHIILMNNLNSNKSRQNLFEFFYESKLSADHIEEIIKNLKRIMSLKCKRIINESEYYGIINKKYGNLNESKRRILLNLYK